MATREQRYGVTDEGWEKLSQYEKLVIFLTWDIQKTAWLGLVYMVYALFLGAVIPIYCVFDPHHLPTSTQLIVVAFIGLGLTLVSVARPLLNDGALEIKRRASD